MIYRKNEFIMFQCGTGFIIYNTEKEFMQGHSHVKNKKIGRTIIDNVIKGKIPKTLSFYLMESHIRISNNEEYKQKIQELIETRKAKGRKQSYLNRPAVCR